MLIKSIDIIGFKSFADKTTLKFGNGLTAVVGPNGSGKSNVSDAVRWVLGEQSTKNLRGNSMEDVIFNGTATRKPHGFCEVTINFDNSDRSLNFGEDNVSVTRRYYRSHESEYLLNGASVRLKDINELFMDTGLGRDGYSMIGQGKVDAIVNTKSNERRDIFEEASGISRYRYRKSDAERKLQLADDNLVRLNDIMAELKSRVGPLKEQSEKAQKFLELSDIKKNLEIGLWLKTLSESKENFRNQESKIAIATGHYAEIEKELQNYDELMEKNSADFSAATSDIDRIREEISAIQENIVRRSGEIDLINSNIEHNTENITRLQNEKNEIELSDGDAASVIEEKNKSIEKSNEKLSFIENEITKVNDELSGLITDSESVSRKMEQMALKLNGISIKLSESKVEGITASSSAAEITARNESIDGLIEEKQNEINDLEKEMTALKGDLERTNGEIQSAENTVKGYEMRLKSRKDAVEQAKTEIDTLKLDMEEKLRRAKILEDLQHSMEGYQYSVKSCVNEAEKGYLKGIHGPVSTLIKVPRDYSVAIEIALGAAAQNIVTDTDSDAKKAIAFLKSQNKGRATFLPISAIMSRAFTENISEDTYGYVGIASSLITYDKKYSEIIGWLLGRTLIAEDIDCAATIAKKFGYRYKVVTLDGQVVNPGGSLTGGSLSKNAGLLSRSDDIEKFKSSATAINTKIQDKTKEYEKLSSAFAAAEAEMLSASSAVTTANEDKIRIEGEVRRVSQVLAAAKVSMASFTDEKSTAAERLKILNDTATRCQKLTDDYEKQQVEIKAEMDKMSGGRNETSAKRDLLSERLTSLKLEKASCQKDIELEKAAIINVQQSVMNRGSKTQQIENETAQINSVIECLKSQITELNDIIENSKLTVSEKEAEVATLIKHRNDIEASTTALRSSEKEKTLEREKINGELERLRTKKDSMQSEVDDIIKRLYDEYELTRTEAEEMDIKIENVFGAKKTLSETKGKIKALGNVNVSAIEEYKEVGERYEFLSEQIDDVEKTRKELGVLIGNLTDQMKQQFVIGLKRIGENFSHIFTEMFGGGSAYLKLTDENDPLQSGIEIVAKLPGKNVPSLDGLSGGEKALIAISIYFAIMHVNAPPFCFLDEVETALDDINVERFASYMKSSKLDTQFICITHRRGTMEAADMLYGVTMQEKGVTRLIELNVSQLEMDLKSLEK